MNLGRAEEQYKEHRLPTKIEEEMSLRHRVTEDLVTQIATDNLISSSRILCEQHNLQLKVEEEMKSQKMATEVMANHNHIHIHLLNATPDVRPSS